MLDEKAEKSQSFFDKINYWREKYYDCLLSTDEADSIFAREKEDDFSIRHPEDFS